MNDIDIFEGDNLNENYFKECISDIVSNSELLKYDNDENEDEDEDDIPLKWKKNKSYLELKIVQENFRSQSKSLIDLKIFVEKEIKTKKIFKNKDEEYLFYINLLIKDETNKLLLKKYLKFLKDAEEKKITISYPHETFKDELDYYLPFLEEDELIKEFNYQNFISEKTKVKELLENIKDSIEKETFNEFKQQLKKIKYIYNQPIPLDSSELIFLRYRRSIIEAIKNFKSKENEEYKKKEYLKHIINKILDSDIMGSIELPHRIIPLLNFIKEDEDKESFDFYFNLINPKIVNAIKEKGLKYNEDFLKLFSIDSPNELCLDNITLNEKLSKKYDFKELYNFDYLIKHPSLSIDITKIKIFLKDVLRSNLFKELFYFLTGNNNYDEIFNSNMINYIIDQIQFIPINYSKKAAFFDKVTLTIYMSIMKQVIFCSQKEDHKIYSALENGIIIEAEFHEFGHIISAVLSYINNKSSTPKFIEGGYYIEMALFGKSIKTLTYEEALYILNISNYNKSLDEFRSGFEFLKDESLIIKGPFENLNINIKSIESKRCSISTKKNCKNWGKESKITIPLKNDIKGRNFTNDDLLQFIKE